MLLDGDKDETKVEAAHFLHKIKLLLREAIDGLLTSAEVRARAAALSGRGHVGCAGL